MSAETTSQAVLENEYLPVRAKILEVAASLDRIERATGDVAGDPRWQQLRTGVNLLLDKDEDRAEQVQLLFSRSYDPDWRETFEAGR